MKPSNSEYWVYHEGKIVGKASSIAGARNRAIDYGNENKVTGHMRIYDPVNNYHADTVFVEPHDEFGADVGLTSEPIKKSGRLFSAKTFVDPESRAPVFFEVDGKHFDIDKDRWCDKDFKVPPTLEPRSPTPSDCTIMAISQILSEEELDELIQQGYPLHSAKKVLKTLNEYSYTRQRSED